MSKEEAIESETESVIGDPADAPVIFIDGVQGLSVTNDVAKINLYQVIQDVSEPDAPSRKIIVARLAMSMHTLVLVRTWLSEAVKIEVKEDE